ncbi:MAG: hypothetical protein IRZ21_00605 [Thermoleophilaceae bacterium]|nr:hypothetical protein [Thermoleophilaceae bacterium]
MSFLIDAPLLYASGEAYARLAPERAQRNVARFAAAATVAGFWGVSIPLYLNAKWTRPVWKATRARSGRDWMLNSGVLRIDHKRNDAATHLVAGMLFATYPLWLLAGYRHGRRARAHLA